MTELDTIRDHIQYLYKTHPNVHVNVTLNRPRRMTLNNLPAVIKGVYPHMFQIEDKSEGKAKLYMHQYTDVVTKDIEILELPTVNRLQ